MLPHAVGYFVPIPILLIWLGSFYVNINRARKRVAHWKGYSTWLFSRSSGAFGIRRRAEIAWIKLEGYDEAEALMISRSGQPLGLRRLVDRIRSRGNLD